MRTFGIIITNLGLVLQAAAQPAITNATESVPPHMYVWTYQINTNTFFSSLTNQVGAKLLQGQWEVLTNYFKKHGVEPSSNFTFFYKPRLGYLTIATTEQNHERIKTFLPLALPPPEPQNAFRPPPK